jgi:tetratricopeptide (TPR) repeat protein
MWIKDRVFSATKLIVLFTFSFLCLKAASPKGEALGEAEHRYQHTDYQGSVALLNQQTDDARVNFLLGRDFFMLGEYKKSTEYIQKAIAAQPSNGDYEDWLGKIYGKRAEVSNPLLAPGLAVKARQAFERSIELNPKSSEALDDLFEYYLEAPGFLGGGYEKAKEVAARVAAIDPSEGHSAEARLAQKRKEYANAESQLRQAIDADPNSVGHRIALARFLARQGRTRESDEVLLSAEKVQPDAARVWFARADLMIKQNRDLDEAKALLEKYIQAPVTVDDPPKQQAEQLLRQAGGA